MIVVVMVLEILAILANLVLPMTQDASLHGRAAEIAHEMVQVSDASLRVRGMRSDWPDVPAVGSPPAEIVSQMPPGFTFTHADYHFEWTRWSITDPAQLGLQQTDPAGVTVVTDDPRLAALVARELPAGRIRFTAGDRTTLVIDGSVPSAN